LIQKGLKNFARVHSIPNLKVRIFVTLRALDLIKLKNVNSIIMMVA